MLAAINNHHYNSNNKMSSQGYLKDLQNRNKQTKPKTTCRLSCLC